MKCAMIGCVVGKDLSKISMPVSLNEPLGALQVVCLLYINCVLICFVFAYVCVSVCVCVCMCVSVCVFVCV